MRKVDRRRNQIDRQLVGSFVHRDVIGILTRKPQILISHVDTHPDVKRSKPVVIWSVAVRTALFVLDCALGLQAKYIKSPVLVSRVEKAPPTDTLHVVLIQRYSPPKVTEVVHYLRSTLNSTSRGKHGPISYDSWILLADETFEYIFWLFDMTPVKRSFLFSTSFPLYSIFLYFFFSVFSHRCCFSFILEEVVQKCFPMVDNECSSLGYNSTTQGKGDMKRIKVFLDRY